jgi:hypothetical protein
MNTNKFILIEYNNVAYPEGYTSNIKEIAGHLDKTEIESAEKYSLHTEYSYGVRKFDSELISSFEELKSAHKNSVPQLWKSEKWAQEFAEFIIALTQNKNTPDVIEIHPPFNDYCDIDMFLKRYVIFEKRIREVYPETIIVVENRSGAIYKGGRFVVGKAKEIVELCRKIKENNINLGVVLDFPQLLTAENIDTLKFNEDKYLKAVDDIAKNREIIKGIHIWGKKKSESGRWVAHAGNLDTYFGNNQNYKSAFIKGIMYVCNDDMQRFLVPEVNTGADDLACIINDIFSTEY